MTRNQIEYQKLKLAEKEFNETGRHNLATEAETQRSHEAQELELNRHNVQTENQALASLVETSRHNQATESLTAEGQKETARHNLATEVETNRSNVEREKETYRSNVARETETARHNQATEGEAYRHNYQTEQVQWGNLYETQRSNMAREFETNRHNLETESVERTKTAETARHNVAVESETHRANAKQEQLKGTQIGLQRQETTAKVRQIGAQTGLLRAQKKTELAKTDKDFIGDGTIAAELALTKQKKFESEARTDEAWASSHNKSAQTAKIYADMADSAFDNVASILIPWY